MEGRQGPGKSRRRLPRHALAALCRWRPASLLSRIILFIWQSYKQFIAQGPSLDDYKERLKYFGKVEVEIDTIPTVHNIGALSLNTSSLKTSFKGECNQWKLRFADNLHARAKEELERLTEYIRVTNGKLTRDVNDLDTLRFMMLLLKEVRVRESGVDMEIDPIMNMYHMLENFLPAGFMEKEEIDKKTVRSCWGTPVGKLEGAFVSEGLRCDGRPTMLPGCRSCAPAGRSWSSWRRTAPMSCPSDRPVSSAA